VTAWVIWLVFAVVLGVAEIFTLTAVLGLLGAAALITSGAAALGLPLPLQLLLFALCSAGGLLLVRPIARRQRQAALLQPFGIDALVGRSARALTEINADTGVVRLNGEDWTARSLDEHLVIPAGTTVNVIQIDGATAVVYPEE
jgi:membrane protein implicated in regulation of membrane protease activity